MEKEIKKRKSKLIAKTALIVLLYVSIGIYWIVESWIGPKWFAPTTATILSLIIVANCTYFIIGDYIDEWLLMEEKELDGDRKASLQRRKANEKDSE